MKRTKLNPVSLKQQAKNRHWAEITNEKAEELRYICQRCGKIGQRIDKGGWDYLDGHHIIKRRFNLHTKENCYIVHRVKCHEEVDKELVNYGAKRG